MGDIVSFVFHDGLYRRLASLTAISALILQTVPLYASNLDPNASSQAAHDILTYSLENQKAEMWKHQFDKLQISIEDSATPLDESLQWLRLFLQEVNAQHGLHLTVAEAATMIRKNLHILQLPTDKEKDILAAIELLQSASSLTHLAPTQAQIIQMGVFSPTTWGMQKWLNSKKRPKSTKSISSIAAEINTNIQDELPGSIYIGAVEVFAGALTCVLGLVYAPAYGVGMAVMADGAKRVMIGLEEMDRERRVIR